MEPKYREGQVRVWDSGYDTPTFFVCQPHRESSWTVSISVGGNAGFSPEVYEDEPCMSQVFCLEGSTCAI